MSALTALVELLQNVGIPAPVARMLPWFVISVSACIFIAQFVSWAVRVNADTGLFKTRATKIKESLARIDEQLKAATEHNSDMVPLLRSKQDLLLFEELTGVQAKPRLRKKLVYLYEISPSPFRWAVLRDAVRYIPEETPDVQIHIPLPRKIWCSLMLFIGVICLIFAALFSWTTTVAIDQPSARASVIEGFTYTLLMSVMGVVYFAMTLSTLRAWHVQVWYHKHQKAQTAQERSRVTPTSNTPEAAQQS